MLSQRDRAMLQFTTELTMAKKFQLTAHDDIQPCTIMLSSTNYQ